MFLILGIDWIFLLYEGKIFVGLEKKRLLTEYAASLTNE